MEMVESCISISMSDHIVDPVLGSLWGTENYDLDEPMLEKLNRTNFQQDETTYEHPQLSPLHIHDSLLELQLESAVGTKLVHDWGALDDQIYREQLERSAHGVAIQQASTQDEKIVYSPTSPGPQRLSSLGLHSFMALSSEIPESPTSVSLSFQEPSTVTPKPSLSRSGSTSSIQTERGRSRIKSKPKLQKPQPTESFVFQEHTFRARSTSRASASSGRRGPLDAEARAKMVAVKGVGPCWRCKALRKSVSPWRCLKILSSSEV